MLLSKTRLAGPFPEKVSAYQALDMLVFLRESWLSSEGLVTSLVDLCPRMAVLKGKAPWSNHLRRLVASRSLKHENKLPLEAAFSLWQKNQA